MNGRRLRILLIRHGRSAHAQREGLVDRAGIEAWRTAYDAAGLAPEDRPPRALQAEVARADVIATSDLPRAADSAARLAPDRPLILSPLLREVPLRVPALSIRAPYFLWGAFIRMTWLLDIARGRDTAVGARQQVASAAAWCAQTAREAPRGSVAIVTHGVVRRLLTHQLAAHGWQTAGWHVDYRHWSVWRVRQTA